jgi:transcriptional regulator with XRE-family HTH domain
VSQDKISSGISKLDTLIDGFHIGDNVLWETVAGSSHQHFLHSFLSEASKDKRKTIYISFNNSPYSVLARYADVINDSFILLDCFTSGKGKDDHTFTKYYENGSPENVVRINRPGDIDLFTKRLNEIEDSLTTGACYVFDSLTGMQDLWGDEEKTYRFFTYMCPRLYDLETVAHWIMEKDAHSSNFKANLRHITQVVLDLSKKNDNLFIKAIKLDGRQDREAFKAHQYRIYKDTVSLLPSQKEVAFDIDIGSRIRRFRTLAELSQKELADKVGLTSSSISQLENNQISPTMNNFVLICNALNISPAEFWHEKEEPSWIIRVANLQENEKTEIFKLDKASGFKKAIEPSSVFRYNIENNRFIYVLKGNVTLSSNNEKYNLFEGDAALLERGKRASFKNSGSSQAQLLCIED